MSSHLPPPIAPPSNGAQTVQPQHTIGQTYAQQPQHTYPHQDSSAYHQPLQNGFPGVPQPLQGQYMNTQKPSYAPNLPPVQQVIGHISNYHSKDSHREDNTYHPSLSPKQTAEALVESAVARHHTRVDVLFLKGVWGGILLS